MGPRRPTWTQLSGPESGCRSVNEALGLLLHPVLIVKLNVLFVFSAVAVSFTNAWRIVSQMCVAVVAEILAHPVGKSLDCLEGYLRSVSRTMRTTSFWQFFLAH